MEEDRYIQSLSAQDANHEDEAIDTLSLSDLMIYDNNGDPQDFYQLNNQNPIDLDDQFEFSSELLQTSINNSVVFCGKIIPYKESIVSPNTHKLESKRSREHRWTFVSVFKESSKSKSSIYSEKLDSKYEVPFRRVSILASATKPRWYLLMFGYRSSSFSAQHIRDLKKRQTSMVTKDRKDREKTGGDDGGVGSWRLMRFLGCGGGGGGGGGGGRGDSHHPIVIKKIERVN